MYHTSNVYLKKYYSRYKKKNTSACITKCSDKYRLNECHFVYSKRLKSKVQFSSSEQCHFFTFYTDIRIKGSLLSPLSLKFASNEHRGSVRDPQDYHFPHSNVGCRSTTQWHPGVGTLFSLLKSPKFVTPKTNNHQEQVEDLLDYPFLPRREAPASLMANLAHSNFATFSHSIHTQGLKVAYHFPYL